jgi:hypothetical protein
MVTGCGTRAMLFRNTTHVVDMLCFLVDADPQWLVAELDDQWSDYPPHYAGDGGKDPATDPGVSAYVHFQNGVRAFINCSQIPSPTASGTSSATAAGCASATRRTSSGSCRRTANWP